MGAQPPLPGSAALHQAGHGSLTCALRGLQKGPVRQLPPALPTNTGMNCVCLLLNIPSNIWRPFPIEQLSVRVPQSNETRL